MRTWRAILRPYRVELTAAIVLGVLMTATAGAVAADLLRFQIPDVCLRPNGSEDPSCQAYAGTIMAFYEASGSLGQPAMIVTLVVPILAAMVLGLAILGRELEQQTTNFAWSIAPSRGIWLRQRLVPILVVLLSIALVAAALSDLLLGLQDRSASPWANFNGLGLRGIAIAGTAILVFGIALLAGSLTGRQLPALLVAGAVVGGAIYGVQTVSDAWLQGDAQYATGDAPLLGAKYLDAAVRTPEGEFISYDEAYQRYGQEVDQLYMGGDTKLAAATKYVPGDRYMLALMRFTGLCLATGVIAIGLTFLVVGRRRPY